MDAISASGGAICVIGLFGAVIETTTSAVKISPPPPVAILILRETSRAAATDVQKHKATVRPRKEALLPGNRNPMKVVVIPKARTICSGYDCVQNNSSAPTPSNTIRYPA